GSFALRNGLLHTFACFNADILNELVAENSSYPKLHVRNWSVACDSPEFSIVIAQVFKNACTMLHITRNTINTDTQHNVDIFALNAIEQSLDSGACFELCTANAAIFIDFNKVPTALSNHALALFDLRFDR